MLQMLQMLQTPCVKETETKWYHTGLQPRVSTERRGFNPNLQGVRGRIPDLTVGATSDKRQQRARDVVVTCR